MKQLINIYEFDDFDANDDASLTDGFDVSKANDVHVFVEPKSGTHGTHVLEVKGSGVKNDGTHTQYYTVPSSDINQISEIRLNACTYHDMKIGVKTKEGSASTVDITVNTYWTLNP